MTRRTSCIASMRSAFAMKMGEYVPLTLSVRAANGTEQTHFINAEVRRRSPTDDEAQPHGHQSHKH